ncbi:hypothetical protein BH20ACT2_BH20ACT2_22240 [soil metagenome]
MAGGLEPAEMVRLARRRLSFTQRELAARSGVPQPTIARIERGTQMPRADTLARLLGACGYELRSVLVRDEDRNGVDLSLLRANLALSPAERFEQAVGWGRFLVDVEARRLAGWPAS